jgi:hypothetical protein
MEQLTSEDENIKELEESVPETGDVLTGPIPDSKRNYHIL